ncbi:tyrosine-type recombinase/integrase [Pseudohaliea sp.]|uniref:tyrosine-type recombinase/integrase n=1 Tax=Pseudohaliea sp. TaxID=2740289 RepID=UPI0032EE709C
MPRTKLTQHFIDTLPPPPGERTAIEYNDTDLPGFHIRASASSSVGTFVMSYKDGGNRRRHVRIGRTNELTLKEARQRAMAIKADVLRGDDPAAALKEKQAIPTLGAFLEQQYLPYSQRTKRSYISDESICRLRVIPEFGPVRMDKLTRKQLVAFHQRLLDEGLAPATCNHYVKLIRAAYNKAMEWEVVTRNPAAGIKLFHEDNQVDHILTDEELGRLLRVLRTDPNRAVCSVCLFLLATGARKSEALYARWEHIDEAARRWTIPSTTAKSRKVRSVPLNDTALAVLQSLPGRERGGWLFLSSRGDRMTCISKVWKRLRKAAGLPHLRLHDLRHCAASMLVNSGRSLYEVQAQLGHASPIITQRYAHLSTATMQEAANSIDTVLDRAAKAAESQEDVGETEEAQEAAS